MAFYVGKTLQIVGLIGVGSALLVGVTQGDAPGAMMREIAGALFGVAVFWAGRLIESWR